MQIDVLYRKKAVFATVNFLLQSLNMIPKKPFAAILISTDALSNAKKYPKMNEYPNKQKNYIL